MPPSEVETRFAPGFVIDARKGEAKLSLLGRQSGMSIADTADGVAVVLGRLFYTDELACDLGLSTAASDAEIALSLIARDGGDGFARLEGDFSLAVIDLRRGVITAGTDVMGGFGLYWTETADGISVSTALHPIAAAAEPTPHFLGEVLSLPMAEIGYTSDTAFKGVLRLVAGSRLDIDLATCAPRTVAYWNWAERIERPRAESLADVSAEYCERLASAVRQRMLGQVSAHVSGGMDSSAVAVLAADRLGSDATIDGISMVYDEIENLRQERPFIDAVYAARPRIRPHIGCADDHLDYDGIGAVPPHDEPFNGLFRFGLSRAGIEIAAEAGADTLLTGFGADEVLSNAPFYIADLLRAGRLASAYREAARWSQAQSCSVWRYLTPFGLKPLMPSLLSSGLGPWLRGGYAPWLKQDQTTIAPWVDRSFAREVDLRDRMLAHIRANVRGADSVVLSEALARLRYTSGDWVRRTIAAPLGVHMSHPFRDRRVMTLGLGARLAIRPEPHQQKPLLATAMQGIIPDPILRRRGKTHFNAVYFKGLGRNIQALEALIADPNSDPSGFFDKQTLRQCLYHAALGVTNVDGMVGLNNTMAIMAWFARLPEWRAEGPAPREHRRIRLSSAEPKIG